MTPEEFVQKLKKKDKAFVVFLSGELGAGKTTFTQGVAKVLGITEDVTSPTFVILKRYEIPDFIFKNLIHIDAYRLKGYDELQKIRFEEYVNDADNLILLEWPEMVESENLKADMMLRFEYGEGEGERKISVKYRA